MSLFEVSVPYHGHDSNVLRKSAWLSAQPYINNAYKDELSNVFTAFGFISYFFHFP